MSDRLLGAQPLGHVQKACPAEEHRRQSGRCSGIRDSASRCLPAGLHVMAMKDANPVRFTRIVERRLLPHQ